MEAQLLLPSQCHSTLWESGYGACKYCGKPIKPTLQRMLNSGGYYCNRQCSGRDRSGEKSPHWQGGTDNYRGENWNRQRTLARQLDGGKCQYCGRKPRKNEPKFPVHHIQKAKHFKGDWDAANSIGNLITLCPQCHPKAERGLIQIPVRLL